MMKMRKRNGSCLGAGRMRETLVRWGGVFAVLAIICAAAFPAITKTKDMAGRLDGVGVSIEAADGAIPDDASLVLNRVLLPGAGEEGDGPKDGSLRRLTEYEAEKILKAARNGDGTVEGKILNVVDISLEHKGSEIEPSDAVRLRIQSDLIRKANQPAIVHLDDKGNAALFTVLDENGETICLDENDKASARDMESTMLAKSEEPVLRGVDELSGMTDSFSVYAIVDLVANSQGSEENVSTEPFEFADSTGNVDVHVSAPASAFPAGTTMRLSMVETGDVMNTVSQAVGGEIAVVQAVDIAFCNAEGVEIEPSEPINVTMRPHGTEIDAENSKLVHIGAEETTVVDNASFDGEQVTFDSDEFSTYAIIIILGAPGEHIYEGDGVTIKVSYGKDAGLPNGTEMVIRELEKGTPEYEEYFARTEKALNMDEGEIDKENISLGDQFEYLFGGGYKLTDARIYDIELFYNGAKIEPAAPVNVETHYDDADKVDDENMKIVHFADDGTEIISNLDVKTTKKSGATISYQQESFSVTAMAMASDRGNGGWWFTDANNPARNQTHRLRFRYNYNNSGVFEMGYPGNYKVSPYKDNADWSWPGDPGYPFAKESGRLEEGTTIEAIMKALATAARSNAGEYYQSCAGVDFLMYGTYTVDDANWKANGSRNDGFAETEVWTGEFYGSSWGKPLSNGGAWKDKSISITRATDFNGPLIHITSSSKHPVHARTHVVINNSASGQTAVMIENEALLMMEVDSHIIGGNNKNGAVGTGVYLDKGGSVEFFDNSFVTNMNVAVEQKNGKTRLKTSPNPFGESNGRYNMNDGNTTGVALWPGQSIGKWIGTLSEKMKPVPILLRNLDEWKSGDIVMDSGRWWRDEVHSGAAHDEMYGAVVASDLGSNKFYFQKPEGGVNMALEYYSGGKEYTSDTVTKPAGGEQIIGPRERYPVIRFTRGTVYNANTKIWYRTLYDAVNNENPMITDMTDNSLKKGRKVQSGDELVFYGSTVEDKIVTIPEGVTNLTIRTSNEKEMSNDSRSGSACTAEIQKGIVIEDGADVTFRGGDRGGLTLDSSGADTIITNNGTLNLKDGVTLGKGKYGVKQNGTFNLYEGVRFENNAIADVRLEAENPGEINKYITLHAANPATNVKVELANQFNGRDVVVQGDDKVDLGEGFLGKFPLTNLDSENYKYVYNGTGGPNGTRALELKQTGSALIKITKVDSEDINTKIPGVKFTIYDSENREYTAPLTDDKNPHVTDENGETSITVKKGVYTIKETQYASGYVNSEVTCKFEITSADDERFELNILEGGFDEFRKVDDTNFIVTVKNTPKMEEVQFVKTDGAKPLVNVEFEMYDRNPATDQDAQPAYIGKSNDKGEIVWKDNLQKLNFRIQKDYWLVETKTPAGYAPLPVTKITIEDDDNYTVTTDNICVTGQKENDGTVKFTVVNEAGKPLPNTGGIGTTIYTAIGLALIVIAGLAFLAARNRRKGYGRI